MSLASRIPLAVLTDSYKAGHFEMYPAARRMVAYGEFRSAMKGADDDRMVFYGLRHLVETYLCHRWTEAEVEQASAFFATHNAGGTAYPFPKELFLRFIRENDGYFPVVVEALPEGTCCHVRTPVYQITAEGEYAKLITFFETLLTMVWYPSTVATQSRRARDLVDRAFEKSVDADLDWMRASRLHDFGFRACTSVEQSVIGGTAHLLNFTGTDTMSAAYHAQFELNGGRPVAESIPATEHSVMTSWPDEESAIANMIDKFGTGVFACVMDSYDYKNALYNILPRIAERKKAKGGVMVLRPDSGDPIEAVLMGLDAADKAFGSVVNGKGFKVLNGCAVIQGDGINIGTMEKILDAVLDAGYAACNAAFGMGGGLLQKVNRDTMSFATKLSFIHTEAGESRDVMKTPKTDSGKFSLPGEMDVRRDKDGVPMAYPRERPVGEAHSGSADDASLFRVVYNKGPVKGAFTESFDEIRARVEKEWNALPKKGSPISAPLQAKIDTILKRRERK